jgi:hypothetical protein
MAAAAGEDGPSFLHSFRWNILRRRSNTTTTTTRHTECVYGVNYNTQREVERGEEGITGRLNSSHTHNIREREKVFLLLLRLPFFVILVIFFLLCKIFRELFTTLLSALFFLFPFFPRFLKWNNVQYRVVCWFTMRETLQKFLFFWMSTRFLLGPLLLLLLLVKTLVQTERKRPAAAVLRRQVWPFSFVLVKSCHKIIRRDGVLFWGEHPTLRL